MRRSLSAGTVPDARHCRAAYTHALSFSNAGDAYGGNGSALTNVAANCVGGYQVIGGRVSTDGSGSVTVQFPRTLFVDQT